MIGIVSSINLGRILEYKEASTLVEVAEVATKRSWTPSEFIGHERLNTAFKQTELLVLDVDDGCTVNEAKEVFKAHKHLILSSRNHQKEKHGLVRDRFRVVLWLDKPCVDAIDYRATWDKAHALWPFIDESCKDPARFYYPSPTVLAQATVGNLFETVELSADEKDAIRARLLAPPSDKGLEVKGELWKSTLKFLVEGAPAGSRHHELVKATMNMREQGYSQAEVIEKVSTMIETTGNWGTATINNKDLKEIASVFARESTLFEYQPPEEPEEVIAVEAHKLLNETFTYLADKDKVKGEPTGIEGLDKLLGGGRRLGELTVLMAQAKTGKNSLYHYLLVKALDSGTAFGYASRELDPATEVIPNLLSIKLGVNMWDLELTDEIKSKAAATLQQWKLYFAPGYGTFPKGQLVDWFRRMASEGIEHFMFDHFHYALEREDYESTVELAKILKALTKELKIHIDLIVQPRTLREGEALSLATLRGGAAIGQALDNLFIFERVRDPNHPNVSQLKLEVARHKLARPGKIYLKYDPTTTEFEEVEPITVPPPAVTNLPTYNYRN